MKTRQKPSTSYNFYIQADTSAYKGEWIAITGKKILAHGKDAEVVYKKAVQKCKGKEISLAKVPDEQTLILKLFR